jgi:hypothetical protein
MKHNPALLSQWTLQQNDQKILALIVLVITSLFIFIAGASFFSLLAWMMGSMAILYFLPLPIHMLGYHPVEGWWVSKKGCPDKIAISLLSGSRLIARSICLFYQEDDTQKRYCLYFFQSRLLSGNFRALCRLMRLSLQQAPRNTHT